MVLRNAFGIYVFVHDVGPNAFGCVRTPLVRERGGADQRAPTPKTKRRSYQRGGGSRHQGGGPENTGGSQWVNVEGVCFLSSGSFI